MSHVTPLLAFVCALIAIPETGHADLGNPNSQTLGDIEALMANTGTALSGNAAGVYYNPASLAAIRTSRVSLSGQSYYSYSLNAPDAVFVDGTDQSYTAKSFDTIPSTLVSVFKLSNGTLALSALVTDSVNFENQASWLTSTTSSKFVTSARRQQLWVGPTWAAGYDEKWSFGLSLFGVRNGSSTVNSFALRSTTSPASLAVSMYRQEIVYYGLIAILGAHYQADDNWGFGVKLRTPSLKLRGKATLLQSQITHANGADSFNDEDIADAEADYRIPLDATFGVAHRLGPLLMTCDLGIQLPVSYTAGSTPAANSKIESKTGARLNVGASYSLSESWLLAGGFFWNPTTINALTQNGDSKSDMYSVTFGFQNNGKNASLSLGGFYTWSLGEIAQNGRPSHLVEFDTSIVGLHVASSFLF